MDYCINCGAELTDNMEVCPECGAQRFGRRPAAPASPASAPAPAPAPAPVQAPAPAFSPAPSPFSPQAAADIFSAGGVAEDRVAQPVDLSSLLAPKPAAAPPAPASSPFGAPAGDDDVSAALTIDELNALSAPGGKADSEQIDFSEPSIEVDKRFAVLGTGGFIGSFILMSIPIIGWLVCLIWALGGCKNHNRRNVARAMIFIFLICMALAVGVAFIGVRFFEPQTAKLVSAITQIWSSLQSLTIS